MNSIQIYSLAIGANITFSTASMIYAMYAKRFGSMWMNQVKVSVAILAFFIAMLVTGSMVSINYSAAGVLLLSGFAGLCVGDIFLFRAYSTLGAGRSLVLYSCEPILLGLYGYFFLGQLFTVNQTLAVICMMICVFIFMLERKDATGSWDLRSFMWAFIGICLDSVGVMLTRTAYDMSPGLEVYQVNTIRCAGALVGFFLISPKSYLLVAKDVIALRKREKSLLFGASLCGCFIALSLYLTAVKYAHVGTLSAISITSPVWVSMLECFYHRKLPNFYLLGAFTFFLTGFYLMLR